LAQALLQAVPFPITAPSANRSGGEDPIDAQMVWEQLRGKIDLLLDGGPLEGMASTLLDLTVRPPRILRQGAISEESIRQLLAAEKAG
jgi:L-threonylcarbamoyladenylate synthase